MNKTAQTNSVGAILAMVVGVGVAVMILIFVGALGGQTYQLSEDRISSIGNYSATKVVLGNNITAEYMGHHDIHPGTAIISRSGTTLLAANYTIDYTAGTLLLTLKGGAAYNNTNLNTSYWWGNSTVRGSIMNGVVSSFDALEQTGSYLPIIVLAVVISLVLTLVLGFTNFAGGGRPGRGGAL